jgi:hypothetical protein
MGGAAWRNATQHGTVYGVGRIQPFQRPAGVTTKTYSNCRWSRNYYLTGTSDPLILFIGHCCGLLARLDELYAAHEHEIRRLPESFQPSGDQPYFDFQEISQLAFPAKK